MSQSSPLIALQMDALEALNLRSDSTLYLAAAAARRGCRLFHYEPAHLCLSLTAEGAKVTAFGHDLILNENAEPQWSLGEKGYWQDIGACNALLMRQDPPFDLGYIAATHILDHIKHRLPIINDPTGVRNAPEKLLPTHFPHLMPPTLITRDKAAIADFRERHGDIVIKPLFSYGGRGVFHLRPDDNNMPSLLEMMEGLNREPWVVQKYLPVNELGDKRIILFDGVVVGQFRRIPAEHDARGNMRVGGRVELCNLSTRDEVICAALQPVLRHAGLRLVGLDVIGDYLTEINVTSPTGLVTYDKLTSAEKGKTLADLFWDRLG